MMEIIHGDLPLLFVDHYNDRLLMGEQTGLVDI